MEKRDVTGQAGVGELRLSPLDVGLDLKLLGAPVFLPPQFSSVGLQGRDGRIYLIVGTREEMIEEIKKAGYRIKSTALPN